MNIFHHVAVNQGKVFKGTQDRREVAIKIIPKDELLEEYRERLKDIILLEKADDHENVITLYDLEEDDTSLCMAMQLCKGTLDQYIQGQMEKNPEKRETLKFVKECLINYLHRKDIVHRDIKPSNILISVQNKVVVGDLGLAKKIKSGKDNLSSSLAG